MSSQKFQTLAKKIVNRLYRLKKLILLFLEIHMIKIVLLFAMLVCINDKCAIYFIIVVMISLACTFGRPMQLVAVYSSSILVSIMLLARMIYQVQYITPMSWNVTCVVSVLNSLVLCIIYMLFLCLHRDVSIGKTTLIYAFIV